MVRKKATTEPGMDTKGIDQFELPKSIVTRLAKASLPQGTNLQKDVPLALVKGSSVFINYLSSLAQEVASEKSQKTISAAHVLEAVKQLGWEDGPELIKLLKSELSMYRKITEEKKASGQVTTRVAPILPDTANVTVAGKPPKKRGRKSAVDIAALPTAEEEPEKVEDEEDENRMVVEKNGGEEDEGAVNDFYKEGEEEDDDAEEEEEVEEEEDVEEEEEEEEDKGLDEEMKDGSDDD